MGYEGKVNGRRKAPFPRSILDRKSFLEALDEAGISLKPLHVDAFYQAIHREHYPPLPEFVKKYYDNELNVVLENEKPLKNKITKRKNRNKLSLPKKLLQFVEHTTDFVTVTSRIKEKFTSMDKSTTKLIIELYDGMVVESVLMRYERKGDGRASLCVSSQVGCAMGCTFCATGTMGLSGNLTAGEILEQLVHADSILAEEFVARVDKSKKVDLVRNIVFMGEFYHVERKHGCRFTLKTVFLFFVRYGRTS
jgi:sorting nexin-8